MIKAGKTARGLRGRNRRARFPGICEAAEEIVAGLSGVQGVVEAATTGKDGREMNRLDKFETVMFGMAFGLLAVAATAFVWVLLCA